MNQILSTFLAILTSLTMHTNVDIHAHLNQNGVVNVAAKTSTDKDALTPSVTPSVTQSVVPPVRDDSDADKDSVSNQSVVNKDTHLNEVEAFNSKAQKELLTLVPSIALEHSHALEASSSTSAHIGKKQVKTEIEGKAESSSDE